MIAVSLAATFALLEASFPWIDPVAIDLPGPLDVRWYGLMYLAGFTVAFFVLRWLAREKFLRMEPEAVGDLLFAMLLGVMLGGRIGYILFYDLSEALQYPGKIVRVWEGGMSFHGGLLGVVIAAAWFSRRHAMHYLNLGDALALAVPFGIFAVRVANFINGELYGRVTTADVPWAIRFPTDPVALRLLDAVRLPMRMREQRIEAAYESGAWNVLREQIPLRHPSQLYEALLEGLAIALLLWGVFAYCRRRRRRRHLPHGVYAGLFLTSYGVFRSFIELFRQPDAQFRGPGDPLGTVLGALTMGQSLSLLMIAAGLTLLGSAWHRSKMEV